MTKRITAVICLLTAVLMLCLTGCEESPETEFTSENNSVIANVISVLKKDYDLADTDKNKIALNGKKTDDENVLENGSVEFNLYFAVNDRSRVSGAVGYALEEISSLCAGGACSTALCRVYMKTEDGYVVHEIGSYYDRDHSGTVSLSLTEYDSPALEEGYALMGEYGLKAHRISGDGGIVYSQPVFEIRETTKGNWSCKANLSFDSDYSADELKRIGEEARDIMDGALSDHVRKNSLTRDKTYYEINVYGQHNKIHGDNKDDPDTVAWE